MVHTLNGNYVESPEWCSEYVDSPNFYGPYNYTFYDIFNNLPFTILHARQFMPLDQTRVEA